MNREEDARSVLSRTSGFIAAAGFTHSLNPARNCTYGCTYCYVPTMRIQAGLQPEDWHCGGQFTTFKSNAAILAWRQVTGRERIYCSPLVDPYQPAEQTRSLMPDLLAALTDQSARRVHPFLSPCDRYDSAHTHRHRETVEHSLCIWIYMTGEKAASGC